MNVLHELHSCEVEVFSYRQGNTSTPMGGDAVAVPRDTPSSNTASGESSRLSASPRPRQRCPFRRPPVSKAKRAQIVELRQQGFGINKIARQLRVGTGSVIETLTAAGLGTTNGTAGPRLGGEFPQ